MSTVIQVNEIISLAGGVEVYISQLQPLLLELGWESHWIGVTRKGMHVTIDSTEPGLCWHGVLSDFAASPAAHLIQDGKGLFHVHSVSDPEFIQSLFEIAPVVRTMHEPRVFCPGHGKYWAKSETPCTDATGLHCLVHAYTQQCCTRHPKRLLPAFLNTNFEIKEASHRYACLVANSSYIFNEAVLAGIPLDKIRLLHYFTPVVPFSEDAQTLPKIAFIGRLSRTKGVHHLLAALNIVRSVIPDVHLDLLGDGIDAKEFMALANTLDLNRNLTFHGWADREKVDRYLRNSSVVAFSSIYPEAFGIVGIEAMMRGKPIVAFDVGGVGDWLVNGTCGILVSPKNARQFADALVALLSDPARAQIYGRSGREIAMKKFHPMAHMKNLIRVYEGAMAR